MRDWMLPLIFSVVIVVIQVVFAPILTVFSTVPSFIVSFVLVLSIMRPPDTTYVYAFVLGLIARVVAHTPVGLTPLLLLIAVFCLSRVFEVLDDTSLAMPLIALAATLLVFELLFAVVLLVLGYQGSILDIFAQRVIPATILNSLIAWGLFVILRLMKRGRFLPRVDSAKGRGNTCFPLFLLLLPLLLYWALSLQLCSVCAPILPTRGLPTVCEYAR